MEIRTIEIQDQHFGFAFAHIGYERSWSGQVMKRKVQRLEGRSNILKI
jgi:hypothetical protein